MEYDELYMTEKQDEIGVIETVDIIEVEDFETYTIDSEVAFPSLGERNEKLKHPLLNGRELEDQHPITAITGLREELDDIEALDVVYSDEKNQADYYEWEDENILQENRIGYFVTPCEDINKIKICTENDSILGVTVDTAGFIGGQDNIERDYKYGLVATSGIVHVRCELDVAVGDYVISNNYGYARKNKNGYKVVGRHQINGVEYVEIALVVPIGRMCELTDDIEKLGDRMDDAETNITAAMNVANAAYKKAGEVGEISEEAIKNALEALDKSTDASNKTDNFETRLINANEIAVQAKAISESATLSADRIRKEAVATANDALTEVNNTQDELNELINNMDPLITWEGENGKGISGFIHQVEADRITLGNLSKWDDDENGAQSLSGIISTVGKHEAILTGFTGYDGELKETIAQVEQKADDNGASITSLVSSVDKYSVGEFSQAYGLTREQAKSILKSGYIYIPTEHKNKQSHSETMWENSEEKEKGEDGKKETNEFTPGDYYVWGINDQGNADWIEHSVGSVWISEAIPANSNGKLKYWYINSSTPPQNYEAYALYIWKDEQWEKVNILDGNVTNRVVSMIQQTQDKISLSVANAQGAIAEHQQWIDTDGAQIQDLVTWSKGGDENGEQYNLATIKQTADNAGASVAQVVQEVGQNGVINAASIVTAINNQTNSSAINLNADRINLEGVITANKTFAIDTEGYMTAIGGNIGGWRIEGKQPEKFGKVLFIGDSYAFDYSCIETNSDGSYKTNNGYYQIKKGYEEQYYKGWPEYCAEKLGLKPEDYHDGAIGGHGFAPPDVITNDIPYGNSNTFTKLLRIALNEVTGTAGEEITVLYDGYGQSEYELVCTKAEVPTEKKDGKICWVTAESNYYYCSGGQWKSPPKDKPYFNEIPIIDQGKIYYVELTKKFYYHDGSKWVSNETAPQDVTSDIVKNQLSTKRTGKGWNLKDITHIIIGGGYNDRTNNYKQPGTSQAKLKSAIEGFYDELKTFYSNHNVKLPKISLFAVGKDRDYDPKNNDLANNVYKIYKDVTEEYGYSFYDVHNLWGDGTSKDYYLSDDIHPSTKGLKKLGVVVASCFDNGKGKLYGRASSDGYSFTSGISVESSAPNGVAFWAGYSGAYNTPAEDYGAKQDSTWKSNTPFYVTNNGHLYANRGTIGGWSLTDNAIYQRKGDTYPNLFTSGMTAESDATNSVAFWAGWSGSGSTPVQGFTNYCANYKKDNPNWTDAQILAAADKLLKQKTKFYVRHDGYLHATDGTIGGWELTDTMLKSSVSDSQKGIYIASASSNTGYWMGARNSDGDYTFSVSTDGVLSASDAYISGTITAKYGNFSDSVTIGGTTITAGKLKDLYNYAIGGNGNGTTIQQIGATSGSINFAPYFTVSDRGAAQMSNDGGGFLTLGGNTTHPYVSALNVAAGGGGINFLDSGGQDEVGTSRFRMKLVEDANVTGGHSIKIETNGNIYINSYHGITGQLRVATGYKMVNMGGVSVPQADSYKYIAFYKGLIVGSSDSQYPNFPLLN